MEQKTFLCKFNIQFGEFFYNLNQP